MISAEDLVAYCDAEEYGDDAEDILVELETYAVATIEQTLGIHLSETPVEVTVYRNGGSSKVYLPEIPISVTSVSTTAATGGEYTALESDEWDDAGRVIRLVGGATFPDVEDAVKIVYSAGYTGADWQLPLRRLVLNTVNWMARVGRKASVEELLKVSGEIPGWNQTLALYKRPLYG